MDEGHDEYQRPDPNHLPHGDERTRSMFGGARISPRLWARKPLGALALLLLAIVLALPGAALAQTVTIIVDNLDPNTVVTGTWSQSSGPNPWEA
ncbi:MAG: hypothetical protein ACE10G_08380, partial [Gemmatimonadales bacterium]